MRIEHKMRRVELVHIYNIYIICMYIPTLSRTVSMASSLSAANIAEASLWSLNTGASEYMVEMLPSVLNLMRKFVKLISSSLISLGNGLDLDFQSELYTYIYKYIYIIITTSYSTIKKCLKNHL